MGFRFTGFADEAGKTLDEQISVVQEAGWNSIELRSLSGTNVCDLDDAAWAEVRAQLQAEGITVAGFGGQIANWARPITNDFQADMDELRRAAPHTPSACIAGWKKLPPAKGFKERKERMFPVGEWIEDARRVLKEQGDSPFEPVELQPGGHVRLGRSLLCTVYVAAGYDPPD